MLVDYNSDISRSPSPQPNLTTTTSSTLPTVNNNNNNNNNNVELEEDEDEFDPNDTFGITKINKSTLASTSNSSSILKGKSVELISAPYVVVNDPTASGTSSTSLITRTSDSVIFFNPTYQDMTRPVEGPVNPWNDKKLEKMNTITGHVEQQVFSEETFKTQQRSFHVLGYAANPSILDPTGSTIIGDVHKAYKNNNDNINDVRISKSNQRAMKRKRKGKGSLGVFEDEEEGSGEDEETIEGVEGEEGVEGSGEVLRETMEIDGTITQIKKKKQKVQKEYIGPWAGWENENISVIGPTEEEYEEQAIRGGAPLNKEERRKAVIADSNKKEVGFGEEKSVFHGKDLYDYLGRSYLHIPTDVETNLKPSEEGLQECFLPKKCVHTWSGHTKGVSKIQLFPKSGHLMLSGSLDTRIKLWDVYHEGKCLRTFMGHSKAVHDITFNNDGTKFLSAAFDRQMKLWDTETGQCLQAFSNGKIPYCVKFHPEKQNVFLAGMSDKKIIQYDMNSGEITQEYDQHLGPVNTINFVDDNRRFITTSDDKTIRVWDFDIPVVIKYIAEPTMHSMPAVGMHPNGKWMAMTSLDNQILIFGADSFKQNRKKRFAGHTVAGYACQPQFSPDGRFLSSGDGQGNMIFWDWKTCRITNRIKAHNKVIISHAWLPHESSKVVTSSWDGLIKLWD